MTDKNYHTFLSTIEIIICKVISSQFKHQDEDRCVCCTFIYHNPGNFTVEKKK
jgi:hypothetical protein